MVKVGSWPRRPPGGPVTLLAHRGGSGPWRENTLEAFAGGIALGADGVELDVRRTADGRLVVHHDAEVVGVGAIAALRARELPPWVPALDEALAACAGAIVNVEIKNPPTEQGFDPDEAAATEVAAVLAGSRGPASPSDVVVSSFWPASLEAVHRLAPEIPTGLLVHPSLDAAEAADRAAAMGCVALHPFHTQATGALVDRVHGLDMAVAVWTVNDEAEALAVVEAGVDVVISDRVTDIRRALQKAPPPDGPVPM